MADYPPELVPAAQQMGGRPDVAGGDEAADPGRRDGFRPPPRPPGPGRPPEEADAGHVEAQPCPHALQQGHVALPVAPEVEVVAHHHGPGIEAPDQDLGHEVLGRLGRPFGVEVEHQGDVGPGGGQQGELLVEVGEQQRGRARPHDAGRVPVEGDHDRRGPRSRRRWRAPVR